MIDTLEANREKAKELSIDDIIKENLLTSSPPNPFSPSDNSRNHPYSLITLHRPSNVDTKEVFAPIVEFLLNEVANDMYIIWPIHPRAQKQLKEFGLWEKAIQNDKMILLHPLGYHEMLSLNMAAKVVLTDSGGLQEECSILGTPCLTLRWNTERPITLREHGGASVLVGNNINRIRTEYLNTLHLNRTPVRPELWDGETAGRCLFELINFSG
jgi:UDP-N-acetylglucosamine 2-epimerase (non-hydrolysing)